jgi:hypothetical protein
MFDETKENESQILESSSMLNLMTKRTRSRTCNLINIKRIRIKIQKLNLHQHQR